MIKIAEADYRRNNWRLNEALIQEQETEEKIKRELEFFFKVNTTPEVSIATIWEAHKAYIRGGINSNMDPKEERNNKQH